MKTHAPVGPKFLKPKKDHKVVVAYPHGYSMSARTHICWDFLRQYDFTHLKRIGSGGGHMPNSSSANVTNARNEIVRSFLDSHDADWLWFLDTDMTFEPDILDRMIESAHPRDRPILGALCFSLQEGYRACPTIYVPREDNRVGRLFDYPKDTLVRALTGAGCLLIHRSVLEKMREKYPPPYEWFQEASLGGLPVGEDITFCIRAEAAGIPVHVDTSIKCGHEKPFIVDEAMYDAQREAGIRDIPDLNYPTFVVIAAKDRHEMTTNLIGQLAADVRTEKASVLLMDNGSAPPFADAVDCAGWPLHRMWNHGLDLAEKTATEAGADRWNVAVLNNDLEVPPGFLAKLEAGLRCVDDAWVAYPNHHGIEIPDGAAMVTSNPDYAGQTMSGWAFMIRGETGLRFDEQFQFWYGDSDLQKQVELAGKHVVCVGGCYCNHLDPMTSSADPVRLAQIREDERRFAAKWGMDPESLWLARHPEFGQ
jgi:GT2 family glycosyltransferase